MFLPPSFIYDILISAKRGSAHLTTLFYQNEKKKLRRKKILKEIKRLENSGGRFKSLTKSFGGLATNFDFSLPPNNKKVLHFRSQFDF